MAPLLRRLRNRWRRLPLVVQLMTLNTLVVLIIALVTLASLRAGLRRTLLADLDEVLLEEASQSTALEDRLMTEPEEVFLELNTSSSIRLRRGWFLEIYQGDHERVFTMDSAPSPGRAPFSPERVTEIVRPEGTYRYTDKPLDGAPDVDAKRWIRIGTSLAFVTRDIDALTRTMAPVLMVLLALAPLSGYLLANIATQPVRAIIASTRALRPESIEQRLPVRGADDELDQLSIEINSFLDQLSQQVQRDRDFVANAAHELRSPLTVMMASLDVALSKQRTPEEQEDLLVSQREWCRRLSALVHQLLLLAESDAGLLQRYRTPVRWDHLVTDAVGLFGPLAEENGVVVSVTVASPVWVLAETGRLRQVITNLLDNAVKFTPSGGQISVELLIGPAGHAQCAVRNTGAGLLPGEEDRIFDRFYRGKIVEGEPQRTTGTGLGLSICRAIVEAYGGQIACQNDPHRSVTMMVTLPRCDPPAGTPPLSTAEPTPHVASASAR